MRRDAIVIKRQDNVATAIQDIPGESLLRWASKRKA